VAPSIVLEEDMDPSGWVGAVGRWCSVQTSMSGACWSTFRMILILFFRPLPFMVSILIASLLGVQSW
jgi:hypothetical protein